MKLLPLEALLYVNFSLPLEQPWIEGIQIRTFTIADFHFKRLLKVFKIAGPCLSGTYLSFDTG